jgi:hypothetical protein
MRTKKHPMALRRGDRANFKTLLAAAHVNDLALLSATRKSDGAKVALICAMGSKDGMYYPAPLAVMIEGNPFELFDDPCKDNPDAPL